MKRKPLILLLVPYNEEHGKTTAIFARCFETSDEINRMKIIKPIRSRNKRKNDESLSEYGKTG